MFKHFTAKLLNWRIRRLSRRLAIAISTTESIHAALTLACLRRAGRA